MMALAIAQLKGTISPDALRSTAQSICKIPSLIKQTLKLNDKIEQLSRTYTYVHNFLYLGRGYNYPTAP